MVKLVMPWLLFILIIALAAALWLYRRKKVIASRYAECHDEDSRKAVCAMMMYMRQLLKYCGIYDKIDSPEGLIIMVGEKWGDEWQADFGISMMTFLSAAFGAAEIEEHKRRYVEDTMESMIKKVDELQKDPSLREILLIVVYHGGMSD